MKTTKKSIIVAAFYATACLAAHVFTPRAEAAGETSGMILSKTAEVSLEAGFKNPPTGAKIGFF